MEKGVVKWFNNAKGYGFILSEKDNQDVFVHYSSIDMNGYRTLRTGQAVMYESIPGPKGLHATAIQIIENETAEANGNTKHHSERKDKSADHAESQVAATH